MATVRLLPRARRDLDDIWDFSLAQWSSAQAEFYLRQFQSAFRLLTDDPKLGRACDEIRAGYRKFPVGSHVIFYRIVGMDVEIVRILHQRMDVKSNI